MISVDHPRYKWVALSNTTLGTLLATINASIVLISLPAIFKGIHLNPLQPGNVSYLLWMLMGYMLVTAVLVVTLGRLGDMYGRVKIYNLGFAVFTLTSVILALDPFDGGGGALWLIGWRVLQAARAAAPAHLNGSFVAALGVGDRQLALHAGACGAKLRERLVMTRILATTATIALVLGGATAASGAEVEPPRAAAPAASIAWGECDNLGLQSRKAECGFLSVPLDHAKPDGKKIKLAVSRIRHTVPAAEFQGIMLTNPGGPGGSGLTLSVLGQYVPKGAGAAYDWIGFDPRGVGDSKPALACDGGYLGYRRPAYVPTTAALEKAWRARAKGYAADCDEAGGALLDHLKTTDTVADLDSLRAALGAEKINFYGFSYGTYLGQVYATTYPGRVRRMVLDGNVDPSRVWYDANLDQDVAFDKTIKVYFGWLAAHDDLYHLGRTAKAVEKLYYAEQARLVRKPADGVIGPAELTDVFLQAGYYVFGWEAVASAFSTWVNDRDPQELRDLFDAGSPQKQGADNGYAIYLATMCTDAQWPTSWKRWKKDNWRIHAKAPFETWGNAWYNAPCLNWGAEAGESVEVNGAKAPPILLISETLDAATPYAGSLAVRKRFPRSALIEGVGGTTHAGSLFGNACVDNTIADYLATGALPKRVKANTSDRKCRPIPQPDPAAAEAKRAAEPAGLSRRDLQELIVRH